MFSFSFRNPVSLPDRVKIWLTSVNRSTPSSPNFAPMQPTPVDLNAGDIRSQIEAEWLEIAQWSKWRAYREPLPLSNGAIADSLVPYDLYWGAHLQNIKTLLRASHIVILSSISETRLFIPCYC